MSGHAIQLGDELFSFSSFERWVNKAPSWFCNTRREFRLRDSEMICVDKHGRICTLGKHFMQARDEGTFPITCYAIRPTQGDIPCERQNAP